jgi:cytochrome oxidase Cu insertion factor (SCO1/SenC/PrrC family)/thiol-disulfide isomerase/thioredoxin
MLTALAVLARLDQAQPTADAGVPAPLAVGTELQRPRPLPALRLIDAGGKPFAFSAWRGKYVVLASTLTLCHEVCPMTTAALTALTGQLREAGLANRVVVAEATVDPWRDTPARLRAYRRLTGTDFALLTGSPAQIRRLWKFFGVYYARVPQGKPPDIDWLTHKPETLDVDHTDGLFVIDPAGQERVVDEGTADVGGRLSPALYALLNDMGRKNLAHPQLPWTATEVLDDVYHLMGAQLPASAIPKVTPPSPTAARQALAGSPATLGSLHQQAGQLLGSADALTTRLHALRGYPVVLNAWASWCGPCRSEFGIFASASAAYGKRVAFLGVNTNDNAGEARSFLAQHPVSYPSYQSASTQLSPLAQLEGLPTTIFIDRSGKVVDVHAGQYETQVALDNDVARYALGS